MKRGAPSMSVRRLEWTLRARGAELADWPERDRRAMLELARVDPAARQVLADALAEEALPAPDLVVQCRIQATIHHALTPLSRGVRWTAMVACLLGGVYFGLLPVEAEVAGADGAGLVPTIQATTPATVLASLDP